MLACFIDGESEFIISTAYIKPVCEAIIQVVDMRGCILTNAAPGGNGTGGKGIRVLRSKTFAK